jgi:hypothetical protein
MSEFANTTTQHAFGFRRLLWSLARGRVELIEKITGLLRWRLFRRWSRRLF